MACYQQFEVSPDRLAVRAARAQVRSLANLPDQAVGDAELVVSELVANSLLHARLAPTERIDVALCCECRRLVIVVDDHHGFTRAGSNRGGLGFRVLDALCAPWSAHAGRVRAVIPLSR